MTTERTIGKGYDASHLGSQIEFIYLSQEDLLKAGCLDFHMVIDAAEAAMLAHRRGDVGG